LVFQTVTGFKVVLNGEISVPLLPSSPNIPWWDFEDRAIAVAEKLKGWLFHQFDLFGIWIQEQCIHFLDIAIPFAACVGIIWWMCPFLPRSDKAPKLTGLSLIVYMFYVLYRGG
jgi:hypothetical protein